jgi:hypothetical protein
MDPSASTPNPIDKKKRDAIELYKKVSGSGIVEKIIHGAELTR